MGNVNWTRTALTDVRSIREAVAGDAMHLTNQVCEQLVESARRLVQSPHGGRRVPEFDNDQVREFFMRPYRVIYEIRGDAYVVLAVIHANQDVPQVFQ